MENEISERIDREIQNEIDHDIESGLMDIEEEDTGVPYGPPPPPQPSRPPPDPSRFPPRSPIEEQANPVFEAVRNLLNSPPSSRVQFGPTGLTGGFGINGGTGVAAMSSAILSNIMASQIENVHFDASNNQVRFETTIWDSSWNTPNDNL